MKNVLVFSYKGNVELFSKFTNEQKMYFLENKGDLVELNMKLGLQSEFN